MFEDELERDFPLGDGTVETSALVSCVHCGAEVEIALDPGSGSVQRYVEDCEICCRPWAVEVRYSTDGTASVEISPEDE